MKSNDLSGKHLGAEVAGCGARFCNRCAPPMTTLWMQQRWKRSVSRFVEFYNVNFTSLPSNRENKKNTEELKN